MDPDTIFGLSNNLALLGWLVLILLPRWRLAPGLLSGVIIPALLGTAYLYLIVTEFGGADGGFGSIADVRALFANDAVLVAGWIHYLAFDLFVGAWEVRDSRRQGIHHLLVVPCLGLTFMFGPIGLLLYFALRWGIRREFVLDEATALTSEEAHAH